MNRNIRISIAKFLRHRSAFVSLVVLCSLGLVAIFASWLTPISPIEIHSESLTLAPSFGQPFLLGTDDIGRDILSRLMFGGRLSLGLGILAVLVAVAIGTPLGMVAGFFGGRWDIAISRLTDVMLTIPSILIAIVLVAVFGGGITNTVYAIAVVSLPNIIRVVRSQVMVEKEKLYVQAARSFGRTNFAILVTHILPNCAATLIVQATLGFSDAILNAAALGFLGLGVEPPTPEWGAMLADSRAYIETAWWMVALPGICILISSLCFNLVGDGLRDALDPKVQ